MCVCVRRCVRLFIWLLGEEMCLCQELFIQIQELFINRPELFIQHQELFIEYLGFLGAIYKLFKFFQNYI